MIKMMLSGCNGKMGRVISKLISERIDIKIVVGTDITKDTNFDYEIVNNPFEFEKDVDVIVDFSHPSAFENLTNYATEKKIPIVICTTGLSKGQHNKIKEISKSIPVFYSANMSIGVNLLIDLSRKATKLLADNFDIEIIEKHHNQKIDAPSGTALAIADAINDEIENRCTYTYDRHSIRKKRDKNEIGIHSVRGGTIVGEHDVIFSGCDEVITLSHHASSKEIFAVGAIKAAIYLAKKDKGLYDMSDLINEI